MIPHLKRIIKNRLGGRALPLELILHVTGRCNFRCSHCFIKNYEADPSADLSLETIEKLAKDLPDLMALMLTGGEPFLRDDLPEIVDIFSKYSKPKVISLVTNGFLSDRIVQAVEKIVSSPKFNSFLLVTISFDGAEQQHDSIRAKNSYAKALETAGRLKKLEQKFGNVSVGANLTITPANETTILSAARELAATGFFSYLSQNMYRVNRTRHSENLKDPKNYSDLSEFALNFSNAGNEALSGVLRYVSRCKDRFQARVIHKTIVQKKYQNIPCEAGRGIAVVCPDGSVLACEPLEIPWGNIKEKSFAQIWNDPLSRKFSDKLRATKCFCTHECFLSASINFQLMPMLKSLASNLRKHE
jgi:MoaA/NifB/PqqE/SkfB family radical SAM enzyme